MPERSAPTHSPSTAASAQQKLHHKQGVVIAGLDRPALVDEILREHPPKPNGFSVPIYILETDESIADQFKDSAVVGESSRVRFFCGDGAVESFLGFCRGRLACTLPRHIVASGQRTVGVAQSAASGLDALVKEQEERTQETRQRVESRWDHRGMDYWHRRYREIRDGSPARVLAVTTRYSTFVRHSTEDLVRSLCSLGHDARTLIESDAHTALTALLSLSTLEEFDPDLIVVINYPRAMHDAMFPAGCPHVCWIQDAMGHLFEEQASTPTELEFIAGHIFKDATALRDYPPECTLPFPVPVSESKFSPAPVSGVSTDRFDCDIAYVSHQSESVDRFHQGFLAQIRGEPQKQIFDRLRAQVRGVVDKWCDSPQLNEFDRLKHELAESLGQTGSGPMSDLLLHQYIEPIAERMLRHETLEWAAQIASEHDLRFKIFGNGWEAHPTLAQYSAGLVTHDDELRACYQRAGVHLHASLSGCGHQRVYECALSGGLPLSRRSWNEIYWQDWIQINEFLDKNLPTDACMIDWNHPCYVIANHPELARAIEYRNRVQTPPTGWDHQCFEHMYADFGTDKVRPCRDVPLTVYAHISNREEFNYLVAPIPPLQMRPLEILGDPLDLTFSTKDDLEERILHGVEDSAWRARSSCGLSKRVRERVTMSRFAEQLLELVTNRLGSPCVTEAVGAGGAVQ